MIKGTRRGIAAAVAAPAMGIGGTVWATSSASAAPAAVVDAQVDPGPGCRQATSAFLKVFPPDQTGTRLAFFNVPACTVKGRICLLISRIAPGVLGAP
jgi:hypothetical protein